MPPLERVPGTNGARAVRSSSRFASAARAGGPGRAAPRAPGAGAAPAAACAAAAPGRRRCASVAAASLPSNGAWPGQQEVERGRHRVDVGPGDRAPRRGSARARRTAACPGTCPVRVRCRFGHQRLGQAEVADLDAAVGLEEAVRRLDVAMDDAEPMGLLQAVDDVEDLRRRRRSGASGPCCSTRSLRVAPGISSMTM